MRQFLFFIILAVSQYAVAQSRDVPLPESGSVTVPLEEYNRLIDLARKPAAREDLPPVEYAVHSADMKLRVGEDSVMGTIRCDGELFAEGIVRIPLLKAPVILDVRQAGKVVPLEQLGGIQTAILSGPSAFSIMLDTGIPLGIEAGRASFDLQVPESSSARLTLEVPGEHPDVQIDPGLITGRTSSDGRSIVEATVVPGRTAKVWWTTREVAAPAAPREVRFLSELKTLVSLSESDLRLTVLADISVIQGEPSLFELQIPAGFEMTGVTGTTLESEELQQDRLVLKVDSASKRSHQFLITIERPVTGVEAEVPFVGLKGVQRETGEVLVEGDGTMELTAAESGALKRLDARELNSYLRSLARNTQHAAFRYHRQPGEPLGLKLSWTRFPDMEVLAAAAERVIATTVVTSEGRSLTEIKLLMKNQAQPFLKVGLSPGASILTAEVAGEKVKPVQGADGSRVPLLRPGFRPSGAYTVEFVLMHAGAPFAKKGDSGLSFPKMDVPIGLLQWEVFLPELYKVEDFGGDALPLGDLLPEIRPAFLEGDDARLLEASRPGSSGAGRRLSRGQLGGAVTDSSGGVIPGATVMVVHLDSGRRFTTMTNNEGGWVVSGVPSGKLQITAELDGFNTSKMTGIEYKSYNPRDFVIELQVAYLTEELEILSDVQSVLTESSPRQRREDNKPAESPAPQASKNVLSLQRRVAGVLPISVDIPRAGNSYRFVRPLVLDEETTVTFHYKRK